jgi:hypothetical protein
LDELGVDDPCVAELVQGCFDDDGHFVDSWGYPLPPESILELCGTDGGKALTTSAEHQLMRRHQGRDSATRRSAWHACASPSLN